MKKTSKVVSLMTVLAALFASVILSASAALASTCTTSAMNGGCGPYSYSAIPMSNGYNTYVVNQAVNPQTGTVNTLTSTDPGNWNVVATETPCGGCVQTFVNAQQLTNDWNGSGWGSGTSDTPLSALSSLKVNYNESTSRDGATVAQFSPDVWVTTAPDDVMFWADTQGRCNQGSYGPVILGTAVLDGQTWTVNQYGTEIIFVLDTNPSIPNSCAQQTSGTINILAGYQWLVANHVIPSLGNLTQLNTGWEICGANHATFTMNSYSITAVPNGTTGLGPVVSSTAASGITTSGATLNGSVNPEGLATTYKFDYGTTQSYGTSVPVPAGSAGSGTSAVNESYSLTGLVNNTMYHYRIEATNSSGTSLGSDQSFTTGPNGGTVTLVGDTRVESFADSNVTGQAQAFPYTAAVSRTSQTVSFYVDPSNTSTAGRLGIYSDSGGAPGTLLGQVAFTPQSGWDTVTLSGVSITSGTTYWLAELGVNGTLAFRDQGTGSATVTSSQTNLTSLPATWSNGTSWNSGSASFYVTGLNPNWYSVPLIRHR